MLEVLLDVALILQWWVGVCWCSREPPPSPKSCRCLTEILSSTIVLPWSVLITGASNPSRALAALGSGVCTP